MTETKFIPRWQQVCAHSLSNMVQAMLEQIGVAGEDLDKPLVGVANSWNEAVPGHRHLRDLAQAVKDGVRAAGGVPLEFNTIAVCDGMASANTGFRFVLPSRELVADSLEVMGEAHHYDGIVAISSCDKINPGMMMGAARLRRPFLFVPGGIGCRLTPGHPLSAGLGDASDTMCPADKLGTAVTGQILAEALGLALPHSSTTYADDFFHRKLAYESGKQVVKLILEGLSIEEVLQPGAFLNAARVSLAIGASMNVLLHLPAIANETGFSMDLRTFEELSEETPYLSPLAPNGPCAVTVLERVGGLDALMKALEPLLDTAVRTCTGQTLEQRLEGVEVDWELARELGVLFPLEAPFKMDSGLVVLYGSLAPEGSVVRLAGIDEGMEIFEGPARIYDSEMEAWSGIKEGRFQEGDVIVIRNEGLVGGPGMPEESNIAWWLQDRGYRKSIYLITDARFSGGQSGQCVGMISPEGALGGPIGLVEDGDLIRINIPERRIDLLVEEGEMKRRRTAWHPPVPRYTRGYLSRYIEQVSSPGKGAILRSSHVEKEVKEQKKKWMSKPSSSRNL
jgi:dihydroxy-acid dehydratase